MKKTYKEFFIATMMNSYNYALIELEGNENIKNTWCLRKQNNDKEEFIIFLDESNIGFASNYKNLILSNFMSSGICSINAVVFSTENNHSNMREECKSISFNNILIKENSNEMLIIKEDNEDIVNEVKSVMLHILKIKSTENYYKVDKITITLIAINVIMYLISVILSYKLGGGDAVDISTMALYKLGANVNISSIGIAGCYRYLFSMFLHSNIGHLFFNMYALYAMGPLVEHTYGKKDYLIIYFVSGILGSFVSSIFLSGIGIGASGAIFGLLGAIFIYAFKFKHVVGKRFIVNLLIIIGANLFMSFTMPNIDQMGHIGGLSGGLIIGMALIKTIDSGNNSKVQ